MQHAAIVVDADDRGGLTIVGDVEASAYGDFKDPSRCRLAQSGSLVPKTKPILRHHEQVVDPGEE